MNWARVHPGVGHLQSAVKRRKLAMATTERFTSRGAGGQEVQDGR